MSKDKYVPLGVWIFHALWASAALVAVSAYLLRASADKYVYLQTVVLFLTLLVLCFYTHYTRKMQGDIVKQTNVSILPVFKVELLRKNEFIPHSEIPEAVATKSSFILKNIGNGTALNIQIETLLVDCMGHLAFDDFLPVKFERIYSLAPDERIEVQDIQPADLQTGQTGFKFRPDLLGWLVGDNAWDDSDLKIWFSDILGNKYIQVVHIGRKGIWPDVVRLDEGQVKRHRIIYNEVNW